MTSRLPSIVLPLMTTTLLAFGAVDGQAADRAETKVMSASLARAALARLGAKLEFNADTNVDAVWLTRFANTDAILPLVAQLPHVRRLLLDDSDVTDRGLAEVARLKKIEGIGLSGTRVTYAGLQHLVSLDQLKELNLGRTDVGSGERRKQDAPEREKSTSSSLDAHDKRIVPLARMKTLRSLHLYGSRFSDADMASLGPLVSLEYLELPERISDAGIAYLKPLRNLRGLYLARTQVTDKGLEYLVECDKLEYMTLYGTRVTDAGLLNLAKLNNLKYVVLARTRTTRAGIEMLRRSRPGIGIQWPD